MRHAYISFLLALLAACAPSKPQFPMPTARDRVETPTTAARQTDVRQAEPRPSARATTRSTPAPSTPMSSAPTTSDPVASEWAVTAIKGKFLAVDTTGVRVFLNITTSQPNNQPMSVATFQERFIVNYVMYPDYNNRERLGYGNIPVTPESVVRDGDHLRMSFQIARPKGAINAVLLTEISESATGKKALNDLPVRFKPTKLSDQFAIYDAAGQQPLLRNFIQVQDTVVIRDVNRAPQTLTVFRYKHEFDPALPPMSSSQRPAPRTLMVDTTLTVRTNEPIRLPGEGLYYFVADTNDVAGIGLVVTDMRFPRLTRPERLIRPLLYMSTGTEMAELNSAKEVKKALDRYWLSLMSGSEDVAKKAIRAYYGRVEEANQLFTTYKEGWKTDKGMIYIILGAPDRVQRSRDREVWVYNRRNSQSEVNFTFNRKQNQFVDDHYELVRYEEYRPVWFPIVEAWRTGAIRD